MRYLGPLGSGNSPVPHCTWTPKVCKTYWPKTTIEAKKAVSLHTFGVQVGVSITINIVVPSSYYRHIVSQTSNMAQMMLLVT